MVSDFVHILDINKKKENEVMSVHISITATCELVIAPSSNNLLPIINPSL